METHFNIGLFIRGPVCRLIIFPQRTPISLDMLNIRLIEAIATCGKTKYMLLFSRPAVRRFYFLQVEVFCQSFSIVDHDIHMNSNIFDCELSRNANSRRLYNSLDDKYTIYPIHLRDHSNIVLMLYREDGGHTSVRSIYFEFFSYISAFRG